MEVPGVVVDRRRVGTHLVDVDAAAALYDEDRPVGPHQGAGAAKDFRPRWYWVLQVTDRLQRLRECYLRHVTPLQPHRGWPDLKAVSMGGYAELPVPGGRPRSRQSTHVPAAIGR